MASSLRTGFAINRVLSGVRMVRSRYSEHYKWQNNTNFIAFRKLTDSTKRNSSSSLVKRIESDPVSAPMTIDTFKSLLQPANAKLQQKRYQLRWDWHLRNFIYALITPILFYTALVIAEHLILHYYDAESVQQIIEAKTLTQQGQNVSQPGNDHLSESSLDTVSEKPAITPSNLVRDLEERINKLERLVETVVEFEHRNLPKSRTYSKKTNVEEITRNVTIAKVKNIAKTMSRHDSTE